MSYPEGIRITEEMIQEYLQFLERKGRHMTTVASYQTALYQWYDTLPDDKVLVADALGNWGKNLKTKKLAEGTINGRMTALKQFLAYVENPNPTERKDRHKNYEAPPERCLTREEYRLLLNTAKMMGHRRSYLLIKTIGCLGIGSHEIKSFLLEGVGAGVARIETHNRYRAVPVYEPIRTELLAYAEEVGIESGPVFCTKEGRHMVHSAVWKEVKRVCREMGISEEKGTPRNLHQLFKKTKAELTSGTLQETEARYVDFLCEEEKIIGWSCTLA